jgi:hypothetical protein
MAEDRLEEDREEEASPNLQQACPISSLPL